MRHLCTECVQISGSVLLRYIAMYRMCVCVLMETGIVYVQEKYF